MSKNESFLQKKARKTFFALKSIFWKLHERKIFIELFLGFAEVQLSRRVDWAIFGLIW